MDSQSLRASRKDAGMPLRWLKVKWFPLDHFELCFATAAAEARLLNLSFALVLSDPLGQTLKRLLSAWKYFTLLADHIP